MGHPYWPLFDLEVRTPHLSMRVIDDTLERELIEIASGGVHDPDFMPFSIPWTDLESPEFERSALDFYWRSRRATPDSWNILFAVIVDGEVVGSSSLGAEGFRVQRWFETGSWLGREHQGRGIGTEMRVATLHVGFVGFDALMAGTGAFRDNGPSLGVTRKLGYEPNGIQHVDRRGELGVIERYRMARAHFEAHVLRDDIELSGVEPVRELLDLD